MRRPAPLVALATLALAMPLSGQTVTRSLETIVSYPISGVHAAMSPEDARQMLLDAGFVEKGGGESWGKVPVATFDKDGVQVAVNHYEGDILTVAETRIARNEDLDYAADLDRIKSHFGLTGDDTRACTEEPHGARCVITDGERLGAAFTASLTTQIIFMTSARTRQRPGGR
jgi:hypothetical protein